MCDDIKRFIRSRRIMKNYGDTPRFDGNKLCNRCRSGVLAQGRKYDDVVTYCTLVEQVMQFDVTECTAFKDRSAIDLWDMQQIAWNICVDKKGHSIGFKSPSETERLCEADKIERPKDVA